MSVGVSRGRSVAVLVSSGCPGGLLEAFWCYLGCILGPSWAHLGPTWAHVGLMLGHLGDMLGLCWCIMGSLWGYVGASGGDFWVSCMKLCCQSFDFENMPKV